MEQDSIHTTSLIDASQSPMAMVRLPCQPPLDYEHGEPTADINIAGRIATQAAPPSSIEAPSRPIFDGKLPDSPVAMVRLHGQPPII